MGGMAPREEIQFLRIGWARVDRSRAHGQPDRARCKLFTILFRVCEVGECRSTKVCRLDRIGDAVLAAGNANADRENASGARRSKILICPCALSHLGEDENYRLFSALVAPPPP